MYILIVEDDRAIAENLYEYLELKGHQCDYASSLADAERLLAVHLPDVIVLDRNLPDGDGLTLVRQLRAGGGGVPLLMLTARVMLEDKLNAFEAGADDYLVKPFALQELEVRLEALVRRAPVRRHEGLWRLGPLEYHGAAQELRYGGAPLHLPPKALRLVAELLQNPNRVFSRRELELTIWGREQESSDNLRSVLHTLRRILSEQSASGEVEVVNLHGLGYKLVCHHHA